MLNVNVQIPTSSSLYESTTNSNGTIVIGPSSVINTFPGDQYWWSSTGDAEWVASGDDVTVYNTDGSQNYLSAIVDLGQSSANPITFRVIGNGTVTSGSFNVELMLHDNSGNTIYDETQYFPSATFDDTQIEFSVTPSAPVHYAYLYIYAHGVGTLTIRDTEFYDSTSPTALYGEWISAPIDLPVTADTRISSGNIAVENWGFYYEDLDNVDQFNSVAHSVEILGHYSSLVCNEPGLNTSERASSVQRQLVTNGVNIYGYANIGVSESQYNYCLPPIDVITAIIDRCVAAGYAGVFFDGAGSNPGIPVEENNYLINYAHSKGLHVMANAHPQDILYTTPNSDQISNPSQPPTATAVDDPGSTLPAGTYQVACTFGSYTGETEVSPLAQVTISNGQAIQVATTENWNSSVLYVNIYLSESPGSSTLRLVLHGNGSQTKIDALPSSSAAEPPSSNTAWTGNHSGTQSTLGSNDWVSWESFFSRSDGQYDGVPEGSFGDVMSEYITGTNMANPQGVSICGLAYQFPTIKPGDYSDYSRAYLLSIALGWSGLAYAPTNSDGTVAFSTQPLTTYTGSTFVGELVQVGALEWQRFTDQGIIDILGACPSNVS